MSIEIKLWVRHYGAEIGLPAFFLFELLELFDKVNHVLIGHVAKAKINAPVNSTAVLYCLGGLSYHWAAKGIGHSLAVFHYWQEIIVAQFGIHSNYGQIEVGKFLVLEMYGFWHNC